MAKPIQHDAVGTVEEAGKGVLKTLFKAALAVVAASAIIGGGGVLIFGGGLAAAGGAAVLGAQIGVGLAAAGGVAAVVGAPVLGTIAAVLGLFGLAKGAAKASDENAAYAKAMAQSPSIDQAKLVEAQNAGMQQGFQAGAQHVIQQLQAAQTAQQQMAVAQVPATNHAEKVGGPKMDAESYAKSILAQREAQQAAGAQLGA